MSNREFGRDVTTFGIISDIHANKVALEAVLSDMPPVDTLVCAGDVVGYNPWPGECIEELRTRAIPSIGGNHDRAVVSGDTQWMNAMATRGVDYARDVLSDDQIDWLRELPVELTLADGRIKVVHGHPDDPDHYTRRAEVNAHLLGDEDVLVLGHTHVQFTERVGGGIVLNPGSVGQPRDGDPRAAYSVLDLTAMTVEERRVEYDIPRVQAKILAAGLPRRLAERLERGR